MHYERDNIRQMSGYAPGEQPADTQVIKLNTNENPWPPSAAAMAVLRDFSAEALRRYPSPSAAAFLAAAAEQHNVDTDCLVATNGGDELLRLAITTFVTPGRPIGVADPSYSLYPVLAAIHDSPIKTVSLDEDFGLAADFAEQMNAADVPLTFLVNPHAPSGRLLDAEQIAALAQKLNGVLLIDEAYVDFAPETHNVVPLIQQHDNLMILRTLSKGYSLAGLRLGYGIGSPGLIRPIAEKTRDSYSVDALADAIGAAALTDQVSAKASWQAVREERARLTAALTERGFDVQPSHSNFCLARMPATATISAGAAYQALKSRNILVRHFATARLNDYLRISIGTPEQTSALLAALDKILSE